MRKKILFFTGAGISAESGIQTFRKDKESLWENMSIEDVATPNGWRKDKSKVLNFYNDRRNQLKEVTPNKAHELIAELEKDFDVYVITQNVDDLHERAGSRNIIHLHGELNKSRSTLDPSLIYDCNDDIKIGDKCEKGSQLRPHIVWFSEFLDEEHLSESKRISSECDYCIIVGTSMSVSPANLIPRYVKPGTPVYYVDPGEADFEFYIKNFNHIKESATTGLQKIFNILNEL